MATHRVSIGSLLIPDTSGNVWWQPASILDTNDLYPSTQVLCFADSASLDAAYATFQVPKNYIGTAKAYVRYKTTATSGNVLWTLDYRAVAENESGDPTTHQESLAGTATAVPGTTNLLDDISFTLTSANLAADDTVYVKLARNGAGADTVAATCQVIDLIFEYADA